jgi:hypothetical protein
MLGYTFTTEAEAITARNQAATHKGLPNPQGDTLYWVNYNYSNLDSTYYSSYIDGLENVLGAPSEITISSPL